MASALFVLTFLSASSVAAEAVDVGAVVEKVQERYKGVKTLTASFVQETFLKSLDVMEVSKGTVSFKKPGRMRWTYTVPEGNEMVSDGELIWLYDAELGQVIEAEAGRAAAEVALEFLSGTGDIKRDFKAKLAGTSAEAIMLSLVPRAHLEGVNSVTLVVDRKSYHVVKTIIDDGFGGETAIMLKDVEFNTVLEDDFFKFTLPKGATVFRP